MCRHDGCQNYAQSEGGCITHSSKKKRCSVDSCQKQSQNKNGRCKRHGGAILCSFEGCSYKMHSRKMCRMHIRTTMAADTMLMMSDAGGVKSPSFPTAMETAEETTMSDAGGNKSIEGPTTTMIEGSTFILSNYLLFFCISASTMFLIFLTTFKAIVLTTSGLRATSTQMPCATSASFSAFFVSGSSKALLALVLALFLALLLALYLALFSFCWSKIKE